MQSIQAVGAAAARSALTCELSGCFELPNDCDLLAGICLMAGPVNQNDIGKQFYGYKDLLHSAFPSKDPTSLLVWTLKGKTIADPIGNEEQLLNANRKGALVDLRCGPHQLISIEDENGSFTPMRSNNGQFNQERAFFDQGNFARSVDDQPIPGNQGEQWEPSLAKSKLW